MKNNNILMIISVCFLLLCFYGCNKATNDASSTEEGTHVHAQGEQAGHEHGSEQAEPTQGEQPGHEHEGEAAGHEHGEEGEHTHEEEGEESGVHLHLEDIHDEIRKGVRMILSYDKDEDAFIGTVENTTDKTIQRVRVEVHLSNGTELGPTTPIELAPGKIVDVKLSSEGHSFEWWTTHAESGTSEH